VNLRGSLEDPKVLALVRCKPISGLHDKSIKDLANCFGTLLRDPLLVVLIVNISHSEAGFVTLGPLEVATICDSVKTFFCLG
jgi:hypothetical protein